MCPRTNPYPAIDSAARLYAGRRLVININKYAYRGEAGPIEISLTEDKATLRLVVADRGQGKASSRPGFGTRMMSALVTQLPGTIEFEDNQPGLRVVLVAPVVQGSR